MRRAVGAILERWSGAWHEIVAASFGAGLAWILARMLFGHERPLFAAISAIVCLAPGLPSHARQARNLLFAVTTGIVIGELFLAMPGAVTAPEIGAAVRMTLAAFLAMTIATTYGQSPVLPIQAGVSAVLVLAYGPATTGFVRMEDVAVGVGVGFVLALLLPETDSAS